jgi:glyoxylase-like metal-dependent hydrolase (beta-lactamase superfamily II)
MRGASLVFCLSATIVPLIAACAAERPTAQFPQVHQVAGGATEVYANAYIVEGQAGIVVVDALLTRGASRDLRARVDAIGKPLSAVILTHGHPDHYGGVAQLVEGAPSVPVIAVPGVNHVIRRDDQMKGERLAGFGIDWAAVRTFPNTIADAERPLTFGEFTLTPIDLGAGESDHDSLWVLRSPSGEYVFTGDLVMSGVHAYTADAHTGAWLATLRRLQRTYGGDVRIYPGHGTPGGPELLAVQAAYLERFRREVASIAQGRPELTDVETLELERRMVQFAAHDRMSRWVHEGADPVAAELAPAPEVTTRSMVMSTGATALLAWQWTILQQRRPHSGRSSPRSRRLRDSSDSGPGALV